MKFKIKLFVPIILLAGLLLSCQKSKPNFVVNGAEYLSTDEIAILNLELEQHARTGSLPVFLWLQTNEPIAPTFENFRAANPNLKHISKGMVVCVLMRSDQQVLIAHEPTENFMAPDIQERILSEVLGFRLEQGFLFEGLHAATQELTGILQTDK